MIKHEDSGEDRLEESTDDEDADDEQVFQLSTWTAEGIQGRKTIKLNGKVHDQEILILIDSDSSCTFISETAVKTLQCSVTAVTPVAVTVANGQKVTSDKQVSEIHMVDSVPHLQTRNKSSEPSML